jgi:hypothetical protein
MNKHSRFFKTALAYILFLVFLYFMTVINLYKSTKRIDWKVFRSEALPEFLIFCLVAIPIIITLQYLWYRAKKKRSIQGEEKGVSD